MSQHADDAVLVITELIENVTRHTGSACELRLALDDSIILIEVTDRSPEPPVHRVPDLRTPGGRGLHIIAAVAQRWGCRPVPHTDQPGKVVWAELELSG